MAEKSAKQGWSKFLDGFVDKFSLAAGAIGRQRHLGAIRDGFVTVMPIMIVGSIVTLINNFPIGSGMDGGKTMLKEVLGEIGALQWIVTLNGNVWWGTFGMLSLLAVAAIAYNLAKWYDGDKLSAAIVTLATYLSVVPQVSADGAWGNLSWGYLNSGALFVGIILALVTTEIFVRLSKADKLVIKMPDGVPPAVARSFASLFPAILTVLIVNVVAALVGTYGAEGYTNFFDIANKTFVAPMAEASGTFGFGLAVVLLTHIFWLFGVHGANMFEGILQTFNANAVANNLSGASPLIFNKSFADAFIYMGGVGVGLGLVIALILIGKSKQNRMIGRLGAAPGLFNINEPVLFGLPIVLNPIFAVPFIIAPIVSLIVAYAATAAGLVNPVSYMIPWTTPPILSGLFATGMDWRAPVVQLINLALSVLIYLPFVKIADKIEEKRELEAGS
ncbi:MAG: PTS transporter subunit EIIC [Clostridiales bacterium]|nr:PTS transporter subunit EIIC [Clostridiales bacterium]